MSDMTTSRGIDPAAAPDGQLRGGLGGTVYRTSVGGAAEEESTPRDIDDVVFLMGVPQEEVTPAVRRALADIMGEFDRIRAERDRLLGQVHHLEALADAHSLFPILNRRAFLRRLTQVLARAEQAHVGAALLYLAVTNGDDIRRRHGRRALEDGLARAAGVLVQEVRASDVVGALDAGDFAVILAPIDPEAATEKAREIVDAVTARSGEQGAPPLDIQWGLYPLGTGDTPDSALDRAERSSRSA